MRFKMAETLLMKVYDVMKLMKRAILPATDLVRVYVYSSYGINFRVNSFSNIKYLVKVLAAV